jgi:hypothetical protein
MAVTLGSLGIFCLYWSWMGAGLANCAIVFRDCDGDHFALGRREAPYRLNVGASIMFGSRRSEAGEIITICLTTMGVLGSKLYKGGNLFGGSETVAVITCLLLPLNVVCGPHHFDIKRSQQGYWIARDRDGLVGGTFLTCKDAVGTLQESPGRW